jgi:hypothetical protein
MESTLLNKLFSEIETDGIEFEEAYSFVGECMEPGEYIYTNGAMVHAMELVAKEVVVALKDHPEALSAFYKHFGINHEAE